MVNNREDAIAGDIACCFALGVALFKQWRTMETSCTFRNCWESIPHIVLFCFVSIYQINLVTYTPKEGTEHGLQSMRGRLRFALDTAHSRKGRHDELP